jgi:hypothetical protein
MVTLDDKRTVIVATKHIAPQALQQLMMVLNKNMLGRVIGDS